MAVCIQRSRPHKSGYFRNRVLFYLKQPSVHTKPVNRMFWEPLSGVDFFGSDRLFPLVISCGRLKLGIFLRQLRHKRECSLKWKLSNSKWWTLHRLYNVLFATLLAFIAIFIACFLLIWRSQLAISKDRRLNLILIMKSLSSRRRSEPCQSRF